MTPDLHGFSNAENRAKIDFEPPELNFWNRLSDRVARFGGSWAFIAVSLSIIGVWMLLNGLLLAQSQRFDPFPFILLNLGLSCLAALQAPFILMSQRRQEDKDRERAVSDYLVNLKAEQEIRELHQKLDVIMLQHEAIMKHIEESKK